MTPTEPAPTEVITPTEAPATASLKTGDGTRAALWVITMLASLAGAGAVLYFAKRKGLL